MATKKSTLAKYDGTARCRVLIERVSPQIEQGLYPIKRVEGEWVTVEADVFGDGHDLISVFLLSGKPIRRNGARCACLIEAMIAGQAASAVRL
jgi:starch synthase (maltosyl-transferring)